MSPGGTSPTAATFSQSAIPLPRAPSYRDDSRRAPMAPSAAGAAARAIIRQERCPRGRTDRRSSGPACGAAPGQGRLLQEYTMTPEAFVAELDRTNREALERLGAAATAGEPGPGLSGTLLLKLALKNEIEASEIAG